MSDAVLAPSTGWTRRWRSDPTVLLCLLGVLAPNALSLGALAFGIGVPPRPAMIVAYATVVVALRVLPLTVIVPLYLALVGYDMTATIALLFNLAPSDIGIALHLVRELDLLKSPFYLSLMLAMATLTAVNLWLIIRFAEPLRRGSAVFAMAIALLFAVADSAANTSAHYHYGTLYSAGKPMESAAESSGFRRAALTNGSPHVVMVMVEALGEFADPRHRALLADALATSDVLKRYKIETGTTTYYGSTTAAEMRELCGNRKPYQALVESKNFVCLPELMRARGYRTVGMHNFTSKFFDRWAWYPKLGFDESIFVENLPGSYRQCGAAFRGPCDTEMVPFIRATLEKAQRPTFFYWMTLSTHVPIAPAEGTPRLGCAQDGGRIGQREVCFMTEMWIDLLEKLAGMAAAMPNMELLVVGDHGPPLWPRAGRNVFEPGKVPWLRLTPRAGAA